MTEIIEMLLKLSDQQLDKIAKDDMRKWSNPPKAIEVLKTLDMCVNGSLCSNFEIEVLDIIYNDALRNENTTNEEVVKLAAWRK